MPSPTTVVMTNPVTRILHQSPPAKASAICPPAFVPAWARKTSRPNSPRTAVAVKGSAVTKPLIRPILPKTRPTRSVPAAEPMEKVAPVGVRNFHSPMTMPRAMPTPRAIGLMEDRPRAESPKNLEISAMRPVGATTRTRSPSWRTRSGVPTMSTSPRRTREIVAPNLASTPSSATVRPASLGSETVMRRKSR